jgi:hypothetical protein
MDISLSPPPESAPPTPTAAAPAPVAPHPGSKEMPRWNVGELIDAPKFDWSKWYLLLGPGLVMGGSAIGGGEWLTGPTVTAKFGGGLMWLATLSILGQVIYNIEISRYTLYSGEPIFTGKFRTLPGPMFWLFVYLLLDAGSIFPYLAASAATPVAAMYLGHIPSPGVPFEESLLKWLGWGIFLGCLLPLIFGGKIYNALKAIMAFKIAVVMTFLLVLAIFFSHFSTWTEIGSGFFKIGNVPIKRPEDLNKNGILDPGEDWDKDGHLDVVEPELTVAPRIGANGLDTDGDGKVDAWTPFDGTDKPAYFVVVPDPKKPDVKYYWPDFNHDGKPDETVHVHCQFCEDPALRDRTIEIDPEHDGKPIKFIDVDGDTTVDGDNLDNVVVDAAWGLPFPLIDLQMIGFLSALVAISGQGGLSNTPISNYTRDQGWGMGHWVGAIPSVVGGHNIQLSHEGTVFLVTPEAMPRWRRWYNHIFRDQVWVWMPACFFGIALPSMLSVEFLKRGFAPANDYEIPGMTAGGVRDAVGGQLGDMFWYMTLFCGLLVLAPTMASTIDGIVRRWVDVFWTSSKYLRSLEAGAIKYVYFGVLAGYTVFGLTMLSLAKPATLLIIAGAIYNYALGFSCWHTLYINHVLLPRELRPGWISRILLFLAGVFFLAMAVLSTLAQLKQFGFF